MDAATGTRPLGLRAALAAILGCLVLVVAAFPASAQEASLTPGTDGPIRLTSQPLMDGNVRPGSWMGVRVHLENDGPAVSGEIQLTGGAQEGSRYSLAVELPTGARQDHLLYTQPTWSGGRLTASLISGTQTLAQQRVVLKAIDSNTSTIIVVAERPDGIIPGIRAITAGPGQNPVRVFSVSPEDLPPRPEAWAVIDRLVWQDIDPARLSPEQLAALTTWVGAGGRFVIVGGPSGIAAAVGLPADLLPYQPSSTVDVPAADLEQLVGGLTPGTEPLPALTGDLVRGSVLAWSGGRPIAALANVGQGQVVLVGVDPSVPAIADAPGAGGLWRRALGSLSGQVLNPLVLQDDSQLVGALNALPAVALPDLGLLFGLLLLYIALIGPINYLVLRRLDRREWAWITMPVLVLVFGVGSYVVGMGLKGTDVIVDQLGIVRAAAGTDRGLAQAYVGVFSPDRRTFDISVGDDALLANPVYQMQAQGGVPLDVLGGESARLRGYGVGFGVLRAFRAEAPVEAPRVDSDLTYRDGVLEGTITNRSDEALESVAVTWAGQVTRVPELGPGETAEVRLDIGGRLSVADRLAMMVIPGLAVDDQTALVRRAVLDQVSGFRSTIGTGGLQANPVIIAFRPEPTLAVSTGSSARLEGDTLYLMPAPIRLDGQIVIPDPLVARNVLETKANDAWDDGGMSWSLGTGTMTIELRPLVPIDDLHPTYLGLMLSPDVGRILTGRGLEVDPLPPDQQPDQADPLTLPDPPDEGAAKPGDGALDPGQRLPDLQLLDLITGLWVEFPRPVASREMRIASPERYLDPSGALRARFVNRAGQDGVYFSTSVRIEGTSG